MTASPAPADAPRVYEPKVGDRVVVNDFCPAKHYVAANGQIVGIDGGYCAVAFDGIDHGCAAFLARELTPEPKP